MSSSGPTVFGSGASASGIGTQAWTSPGNITAIDGSNFATCSMGATVISNWLEGTSLGFAIPSGATINGILVEWKKKGPSAGGAVADNAARIIKGGSVGSTDKSVGGNWSSTNTLVSYGGSADLWGETWLYSDINASTFGAALSAKQTAGSSPTASVDGGQITVTYTAASGFAHSQIITCFRRLLGWLRPGWQWPDCRQPLTQTREIFI